MRIRAVGSGGETRGDHARQFAEIVFHFKRHEADDTAILAAKLATGRHRVVVLRHSYSGRSATALVERSDTLPGDRFRHRLPEWFTPHAPYCYRCPFKLELPTIAVWRAPNDIEELIQTTTTGEIAAFMAEPILGVGGFIVPPKGYFEIEFMKSRANHGGLCIADEVQTAWGRTGEKWFGIEQWDVVPDIMTSAKGMGNGAPIGWTIATAEVADKFPGITFATFGGNPVSTPPLLRLSK